MKCSNPEEKDNKMNSKLCLSRNVLQASQSILLFFYNGFNGITKDQKEKCKKLISGNLSCLLPVINLTPFMSKSHLLMQKIYDTTKSLCKKEMRLLV